MARNIQLKVLVTAEEYEGIKRQAGHESVSSFCRRLLTNPPQYFGDPMPPAAEIESVTEAVMVTREREPQKIAKAGLNGKSNPAPWVSKQRLCEHGVLLGENCRQCGGSARVK